MEAEWFIDKDDRTNIICGMRRTAHRYGAAKLNIGNHGAYTAHQGDVINDTRNR